MPGSGPAVCSVWWATARPRPELLELLDVGERQRAAGLRSDGDRDRYVTAHGLVRRLVGARTGERPEALRFETTCHRCGGSHGKPRLTGPGTDPSVAFSLSSSGSVVAVALTAGAEVGVDVQVVPELDRQALAMLSGEVLSTQERVGYAELPQSRRARAVAVWWVRKEAVLKATGEGLAVPPSHLTVTCPMSAPAVTAWDPRTTWRQGAAPVTRMRDLDPPPSHVASVAVLGDGDLVVTEQDGDALLSAPGAPPPGPPGSR